MNDLDPTLDADALIQKEKLVPVLDIPMKSPTGKQDICTLLDTGAAESYISRPILKKLDHIIVKDSVTVLMNTLHGKQPVTTQYVKLVNKRPGKNLPLYFYVTDHMIELHQEPDPTFLDDEQLNSAMKRTHYHLDAIIGLNQFHHFIKQICPLEDQQLIKMFTPFGTTYGGTRPTQRQTSVQQDLKTIFATQQLPYVSAKLPMDTLLKAINQLCEIETMPHDSDETGMTMEEKEAIERVKKECVLDPKLNRFVTSLLLKKPTNLANNYYRALAQAKTLHKKNLKNPAIKKVLEDRMKEFLTLDIAQRIYLDNPDKGEGYYSPMRLVTNLHSETTPYRLTSNASATTSVDESLNTNMLQTPVPVLRIAQLALKNRRYKHLISFDIRKMYVQIVVEESQRKYVRFIWLDPNEEKPEPQIWEFKKLIWGLATSAFISTHCVEELINMKLNETDCPQHETDNARVFQHNKYVDDVTGGNNDPPNLVEYFFDTQNLLAKGSFKIGKVASNSSYVLSQTSSKTCKNVQRPTQNSKGPKACYIHGKWKRDQ